MQYRNSGEIKLSFDGCIVQLIDGENQIPVFALYKVSGFNFELFEQIGVLIFVILGVWVLLKERAKINGLNYCIGKFYLNFITFNIMGFDNLNRFLSYLIFRVIFSFFGSVFSR